MLEGNDKKLQGVQTKELMIICFIHYLSKRGAIIFRYTDCYKASSLEQAWPVHAIEWKNEQSLSSTSEKKTFSLFGGNLNARTQNSRTKCLDRSISLRKRGWLV